MYISSSWLRKNPHIPDIPVIHFVVYSFEPLENRETIHPLVDIDCTLLISSGLSCRAYNNLEGMLAGGSTNMLDGTCTLSLSTASSGTSRGSEESVKHPKHPTLRHPGQQLDVRLWWIMSTHRCG